jgi:hypothetical protein
MDRYLTGSTKWQPQNDPRTPPNAGGFVVSYARWSSRSNVYVYESEDGFVTHVAARRWAEPIPEARLSLLVDGQRFWWELQRRLERQAREVTALVPIGMPHDGATFVDKTAGECADRLEGLRVWGYLVPDRAAEVLRGEQL